MDLYKWHSVVISLKTITAMNKLWQQTSAHTKSLYDSEKRDIMAKTSSNHGSMKPRTHHDYVLTAGDASLETTRKSNERFPKTNHTLKEPQPYLSTKDLKLYYFGSKTYERNEKPKTFKMPTSSTDLRKAPKPAQRLTENVRTKTSSASSSVEDIDIVEDIDTTELLASVKKWSDFYDSL